MLAAFRAGRTRTAPITTLDQPLLTLHGSEYDPMLATFQSGRTGTVPAFIPESSVLTWNRLDQSTESPVLTWNKPCQASEKPLLFWNGPGLSSEPTVLTLNEAGLSTESPLLTWSGLGQSFEKPSLAPSGLCPRKPRQHGPTTPFAPQDDEGAALIEELERMKLAADDYHQMMVVHTAENLIAETNDMECIVQFSQYLPRDSHLKEDVRLNHIAQPSELSKDAQRTMDLFRSAQQPSNPMTQSPQPSGQTPSLKDLFLAAQQPK